MLQHESRMKVVDNSGAKIALMIQKLYDSNKTLAGLNKLIVVVIKRNDVLKRINRGSIHRAIIVRTKLNVWRSSAFHIRFPENAVILVNKRNVPISNRIRGPIMRETSVKYPFLGTISRQII